MAKKKRGSSSFYVRLNERVRRLDHADIKLIKLSTATFMFFLMTAWPWFNKLIFGVHWGFWLAISLLVAIRPIKKYFFNK